MFQKEPALDRPVRAAVRMPPVPPAVRKHGAIAAILVVAAVVRLIGIRFGFPNSNCRPDEEAIVALVVGLYGGHSIQWFGYPLFFMAVLTVMLKAWLWFGWLMGYVDGPGGMEAMISAQRIQLLARWVSAAFGVAGVWLVFRSATRLFDRTSALLGAAFLALAFLHVRDSHFGVTDVAASTMAMLALLCAVRLADSGRTADLAAAALAAGLAAATKYPVSLIALAGLLVVLAGRHSDGSLTRRIGRATLFLLLVFVGFTIGSPHAVSQWREVMAAVQGQAGHLAAVHGTMLGRGWNVHLTRTLRYGLGWPLMVAGIAGMIWLLVKDWRRGAIVAVFPLAYYLLLGSGYTVFARYMVPVVPFLCLTAGYAVAEAARWAAPRLRLANDARWLPWVMAACVLAPSVHSVVHLDRLLAKTDNRCVVASWIEKHYPLGASIAQVGEDAGRVVMVQPGAPDGRGYSFRPFNPAALDTDIVLVESSPRTPGEDNRAAVAAIERRYMVAADFRAAGDDPSNVYDRQDLFYLPLAGFKDISRAGPNFTIYVRR
jgi:hypothetical protein